MDFGRKFYIPPDDSDGLQSTGSSLQSLMNVVNEAEVQNTATPKKKDTYHVIIKYEKIHISYNPWYLPFMVYVCKGIFISNRSERNMFKKVQESARKDVERAFGVLKGKWGILRRPARAMTVEKIRSVVYACIILHNMIIKDVENAISPVHIKDPPVQPVFDESVHSELQNADTHFRLRFDLVEHLSTLDLNHLSEKE